jgi:hypothetical protein
MLRENQTAVMARNEWWADGDASEPYEAGWATEAVLFLRALQREGEGGAAIVEISPDGIRWVEEGTRFGVPAAGAVTFARVGHFGQWLRVRMELPPGGRIKVLFTLNLKA